MESSLVCNILQFRVR